jgi:hypothetical protein
MPEKATIQRARRDAREGKSASTQAGEFVRQEMHHMRDRKRGPKSAKQAIAIGLSEARRSGVKLPAPKKGKASRTTRRKAQRDLAKGKTSRRNKTRRTSAERSRSRRTRRTSNRRGPRQRSLTTGRAATARHRRSMG